MISIIFIVFALICYAIGYDIVVGTLFLTSSAIIYAIKDAAKKSEYSPEELDKLISGLRQHKPEPTAKFTHPNEIR